MAQRLAQDAYTIKVRGSNPLFPTKLKKILQKICLIQKLFVNLHRCSLTFFVMKNI